jgi:hypothetical protein
VYLRERKSKLQRRELSSQYNNHDNHTCTYDSFLHRSKRRWRIHRRERRTWRGRNTCKKVEVSKKGISSAKFISREILELLVFPVTLGKLTDTFSELIDKTKSMHTFSPPGPAPDLSYYAQQLADQMGGSDKGPTFDPNQFQYMQASVGPVGQRGPQGKF